MFFKNIFNIKLSTVLTGIIEYADCISLDE